MSPWIACCGELEAFSDVLVGWSPYEFNSEQAGAQVIKEI